MLHSNRKEGREEGVASLRVGESVGQVQHVHLLVGDGAQLLVDLLAEHQVARGAGQRPLARTCKAAPAPLTLKDGSLGRTGASKRAVLVNFRCVSRRTSR